MHIDGFKDHPLATILPLMEESELRELAEDILTNGLRAPITLFENKILDGRNRYRACRMVNVEPKIRHFNGDPVAFIVSANVHRRHLSESQRAMVAAQIAGLKPGRPQSGENSANVRNKTSAAKAAEALNVGTRSVETAKKVLREAPAKEIRAIERGEKTVSAVAKEIKEAREETEQRLDKTGYPIPETILEDWDRADSRELLNKISDVRSKLKTALEGRDVIFAEVSNPTIADLNNAYTSLKCVIPYAVCTSCQGLAREKCSLCKRRGFLSEFAWRSYVPEEAKRIREKRRKK
jgi:hypothetical protein